MMMFKRTTTCFTNYFTALFALVKFFRQPAAAFRAHMLTKIPLRIQRQHAWGLRLHAPLPTARILPKPRKDWKRGPLFHFFTHGLPHSSFRCPHL